MPTRDGVGGWALVGRSDELASVQRALVGGEMRGVVLAGLAGVGKTRLAREVLQVAAAGGAATCWVAATAAAASLPLGAFAPLLPALGGIARVDLLGRVTEELLSYAGGRRLVLGVDDAHLLDETSTALVHQLAATGTAFLIVTVRRGAPVHESITALWKDELAERLEVAPLSRAESHQLLGAALGGQVDGATQHELFELTLGNVLFLRELVWGGLSSGALHPAGGVWRWEGPMVAEPRLRELVAARIGHLEPAHRASLELVAFGEPLSVEVLQRAGVTGGVLEELERAGLIETEMIGGRAQIRVAHPLYGEALRAAVPALRTLTVNRQLADAFEAIEEHCSNFCARVAAWRLAAGDRCDPQLLTDAAREAMAALDPVLTARLARAGVAAGAGFAARYLLAAALARQGESAEAEAKLADLQDCATNDAERVSVATERAMNLRWGLDRPAEAEAVLHRAVEAVSEPGWRAELAIAQADFLVDDGRCTDALRAASAVLDRSSTRETTRLRALSVASHALAVTGRCDEAITTARRGLDHQQRRPETADPMIRLQLEMGLAAGYVWSGRLTEAQRLAETGYQRGLAHRSLLETVAFAGWLATTARARGQLGTAHQILREGVARGRAAEVSSHRQLLHKLLAELAQCAALTGDVTAAQSALAEATSLNQRPTCLSAMWCGLAQPWVAAAQHDRCAAVELLLQLADRAAGHDLATVELTALHDVVRLGAPSRVVARMRELTCRVEGRLGPVYLAHATAAAAHDGTGLAQAASRFAAIGADLLAAETAAHATVAFRRAGSPARALAEATRARAWARSCQGARTPALDELEGPPGLTPREREIAQLAAQGHPSRGIADRLVISVRTVDNTLHEVYGKLGISRRAQLCPIFVATPAPRSPGAPISGRPE